jgi:hypothetical protein
MKKSKRKLKSKGKLGEMGRKEKKTCKSEK